MPPPLPNTPLTRLYASAPNLGAVRLRSLVLHSRSARGYRSVQVVGEEAEGVEPDWSPAPSSTAWRELAAHHGAVLVDVIGGQVHRLDAAGRRLGADRGAPLGEGTVTALTGRGATHVLALPQRDGTELTGMLSAELSVGAPFELPKAALDALLTHLRLDVPRSGPRAPARLTGDPDLPVLGAAMSPVADALRRFAGFNETVLLRGPTGVGKTRLAAWVHARSKRRGGPFVAVNLHAIPEALFEGELFGWRKGAHDKATEDRPGYVASAERGTLFLDEIDKLKPSAQEKLLQLLESKQWRALGDGRLRRADIRFIVATNADLESAVASGSFREDLYYRISELPVEVPSLDERRDEIPLWASVFLQEIQREEGRPGASPITPDALARLDALPWPGNLRQLSRVLRRAWILACPDEPSDVVIDGASLEFALPRSGAQGGALVGQLRALAEAWATEALRRAERGQPPLPLDLLRGLRGLVLEAGRAHGDLATIYRALDEHRLVESRNHQAAYRRELDLATALIDALTHP